MGLAMHAKEVKRVAVVWSEPIKPIESTETNCETNPSSNSNSCSALGVASGCLSISSTPEVRSAYPLQDNVPFNSVTVGHISCCFAILE